MRDHEHGGAVVGEPAQGVGGPFDQRAVQAGGGLVGEDDLRAASQREREDHALRHPAGQLVAPQLAGPPQLPR
ncbi:hypothetical protein JOD67_002626 [Tenggerimyces flavus]|nr:hypothetical protein [Tenggerimyces flavus]MBM7785946.1 hypothetical protein [Tenggerimyces flavus]